MGDVLLISGPDSCLITFSDAQAGEANDRNPLVGVTGFPEYFSISDVVKSLWLFRNHIVNAWLLMCHEDSPEGNALLVLFDQTELALSFVHALNKRPLWSQTTSLCHIRFVSDIEVNALSLRDFPSRPGKEVIGLQHLSDFAQQVISLMWQNESYIQLSGSFCLFCLDPMKPDLAGGGLFTLPCHHCFHFQCLLKWDSPHCPLCRESVLASERRYPARDAALPGDAPGAQTQATAPIAMPLAPVLASTSSLDGLPRSLLAKSEHEESASTAAAAAAMAAATSAGRLPPSQPEQRCFECHRQESNQGGSPPSTQAAASAPGRKPPLLTDTLRDLSGEDFSPDSLWMCLICGHIGCGRYAGHGAHAHAHFIQTGHPFVIDISSASRPVWHYSEDRYVHRLITSAASGKCVEVEPPSPPSSDGSSRGTHSKAAPMPSSPSPDAPCTCSAENYCPKEGRIELCLACSSRPPEHYFGDVLLSNLDALHESYRHQIEQMEGKFVEILQESTELHLEKFRSMEASLQEDLARSRAREERLRLTIRDHEQRSLAQRDALKEKELMLTGLLSNAEENQRKIAERDAQIAELNEQLRDLMLSLDFSSQLQGLSQAAAAEANGAPVGDLLEGAQIILRAPDPLAARASKQKPPSSAGGAKARRRR
ncbi:hypothetical protein H696_05005 [Fonticula alba]|uniref:BRCA1-associated protein n=1 Tax=Fonticula alba TaxID=691883 RepID=A0A058Z5B4_FONAL|nr:hypothetical protein H696_05005 [Fonticula alba]KCV68717.1 hypothetical protein H696_05005 [Fonticula alba]|eukprot:XP_009497149.1 hypothetical protein H696_05005 [Fonticula alba]